MTKQLWFGLVFGILTVDASAQNNNSAILERKGPSAPVVSEYKLPASIQTEVLNGLETELWAAVWYPENIQSLQGPRPVLVFLHGNHATCGSVTDENASSCQYTQSGVCENGLQPLPNHRGYDYVAENLASWGYVVVSVNANRGITCNEGEDELDWGLNLARGRLVLRHLQALYEWSENGGLPNSVSTDSDFFKGRLDLSNVGLMGHSRGGEGVRAALAQFNDPNISGPDYSSVSWKNRIPNLNIKAIFEIAAVDGQGSNVLNAPNVVWNQILPLCDGDVSSLEGRMPFERMAEARSAVESDQQQKSLEFIWGANHNFFNTEWKNDDSWGCVNHDRIPHAANGSEAQKKIGLISMAAFFRANIAQNDSTERFNRIFNTLINPATYLNSLARIDRVFSTGFTNADLSVLDDMNSVDLLVTSLGFPRSSNGLKLTAENERSPKATWVEWSTQTQEQVLELAVAASGSVLDFNEFSSLDLRVENQNAVPVSVAVRLKDLLGNLSNEVDLRTVYAFDLVHTPHSEVEAYPSIRVDLTKFQNVDFSQIQSVQIVFAPSTSGKIGLAQVRLSKELGRGLDPLDVMNVRPLSMHKANVKDSGIQNGVSRLQPQNVSIVSSGYTPQGRLQITLASDTGFPVRNARPQLVIDGKLFQRSKYTDPKSLNLMTFEAKKSELAGKLASASKKSLSSGNVWERVGPIVLKYDGAVGETKVKPASR